MSTVKPDVLGLASVRTNVADIEEKPSDEFAANVNNNPKAFSNAYFDIAAIRVFQ